jgi:hypothetical protein
MNNIQSENSIVEKLRQITTPTVKPREPDTMSIETYRAKIAPTRTVSASEVQSAMSNILTATRANGKSGKR